MVELAKRHLRADVLTHCDQGNGEDSEGLEGIVPFRFVFPVLLVFLGRINVLVAVGAALTESSARFLYQQTSKLPPGSAQFLILGDR